MFALRQVDEPAVGDRLLIGDPDEPLILEPRIEVAPDTWVGQLMDVPPTPVRDHGTPQIDARALLAA
jgi:hypothetical protein